MRSILLIGLCILAGCNAEAQANKQPASTKEVIAFTATWCGPCKKMYPVWKALKAKGYTVRYVDVDQSQLDEQYGVRTIPTTVIMRGGVEVGREVGYASVARIESHYRR